MQVYHASEVEAFAKVFYKPKENQSSPDQALLHKHLGPTVVGTRKEEEPEPSLSQIIDVLNERFDTNFTSEDQLFFDQITPTAKKDEEVVQRAHANQFDSFMLAIRQKITDFMIGRLSQNQDIVTKYFNESEFQEVALRELARRIYEDIRRKRPSRLAGKRNTPRMPPEAGLVEV